MAKSHKLSTTGLPRRFPQCTFYFEPADATSQVLGFGLPAPIDVQVVGLDRAGNLAVARKLLVLANALVRDMVPYKTPANSVC